MDSNLKDLLAAESIHEEGDLLETAAQLAFAGTLERPSPGLKQKLMAAIAALPPAEIHVLRREAMQWRATPFEGVTYRSLFIDGGTKMQTLILRLDPGAIYPRHRHAQPEQCLVLSGDIEMSDTVRLNAGDFEWMAGETIHDAIRTRGGCELLIISSMHDEVLA